MPEIANPLLRGEGLPPFEQIQVSMVEPAIATLLAELTSQLQALEEHLTAHSAPTWQDLVPPLEQIGDRLSWTWGIISHLQGVKNSPELRQVYQAVQPQVIEFYNLLGQSQPIYQAAKYLRASESWSEFSPAQQRLLEATIRDAELAGVGLAEPARSQFNQIKMELAELSTQFSNHLLDATKQFHLDLSDPAQLVGLPPSYLAQAAQAAPTPDTWRITLDYPSYVPFMQHSQRRDLREQLYRAFITRASAGDLDNNPLIAKILQLRHTQAQMLGFANYAELSLASKMAPNLAAIEVLIEELRQASYGAAVADLADLEAFAHSQGFEGNLCHWDTSYWAERLRETRFDLNEEALRPYFPLPQVLAGLFGLVQRLFGVTVVAADGAAPIWHEDVRYFQIEDELGQVIASFYLDPYSRPAEKRGGAWMDFCVGRSRQADQVRLPVAYLICNQTPPLDNQPSLMTFREVETLFHEFGHGLQHMLTEVDLGGVAGINNVEWDAVELASQFMENWCYDRETLFGMARHYQTGEPLPEAEYQKLLIAKNFMSGSAMLRQLFFSQLDLDLHQHVDINPSQVRSRLAQTMTVIPPLPEDQMLCSFGHIFAGGYAAGYYSYKWAEVLSADAFAAFEEVGLENPEAIAALGRRYRQTILALGGSEHPMRVFEQFRGRSPQTEPLLRHSGLLARAA
ncbi:MAG: M3 family metallopeptidase [Pseudanabaenaceae cyanobacterium bins.68]|nr:M3 family metallopeptidase [Pseudanabaenaceae cyanobacterium bins.68]